MSVNISVTAIFGSIFMKFSPKYKANKSKPTTSHFGGHLGHNSSDKTHIFKLGQHFDKIIHYHILNLKEYVGSGPASTSHPQKISGISSTPKKYLKF